MNGLKGKTLLVFGDSIMYGSGNGGFGVGEYISERFGMHLKKYCVGGARVGFDRDKNWIVEQIRRAVSDKVKADFIIFDGFTNDCNKTDGNDCDVPLGDYADVKESEDIFSVKSQNTTFTQCFVIIVKALKKYFPQSGILFVRPHKMGRRDAVLQRIYGERAIEICNNFSIAVADIYTESNLDTFDEFQRDNYTFDSYGWGRGDCTHPNALGYEEKYLPVIERELKKIGGEK